MKKRCRMVGIVLAVLFILNSLPVYAEDIVDEQENVQVEEKNIIQDRNGEEIEDSGQQMIPIPEEQSAVTVNNISTFPAIENIRVGDLDIQTGCFRIYMEEVQNGEYIKEIAYAVWNEKNGQDDLRWEIAQKTEGGGYVGNINIADHNYELGTYQVHVYVTDISGIKRFAGCISQNMSIQRGTLSVEKAENGMSYVIKLNGVVMPGGVEEVRFPIWSSVNGQDDIIWYKADKIGENDYEKEISVMDHRGLGEYDVHAYVTAKNGVSTFAAKSSFETEMPLIGKVSVENYDINEGTFQVVLSDIQNENLLKSIVVPVWGEENGQDDIKWYNAKKDSADNYVVDVSIKNHKYTLGTYNIHVYFTDITGDQRFGGSVTKNIDINSGEWEIVQNSSDKTQYNILIKDIQVPGKADKILFPVWSETNSQDDIIWYSAKQQSEGVYQTTISLKNHKDLGIFQVHAYAEMPNGSRKYIDKTSFETMQPQMGTMQIVDEDKSKGTFRVKISNVQNAEMIKEIQVPIWSRGNQEDIVWYSAEKSGENEYIVEVDIGKHKYSVGEYQIHCYITDVTGNRKFAGKTTCNMKAEFVDFSIDNVDNIEKEYTISLTGLVVPAGARDVRFAVWGENGGQNDLRWYSAEQMLDESYIAGLTIRNHKEAGQYVVHAYCTSKSGDAIFIGSTGFAVEKRPSVAEVNISNIDGTKGTFRIDIAGVTVPSGVEKVSVPVWHEGNQSDIKWYEALKTGEGTYTVNVNVSNHGYHFGDYQVHVYVTMGNGIRAFGTKTFTNISPVNYVYSIPISATQQKVVLLGSAASRVQFPTWSEENGQDDVIWYEGVNEGSGKWTITVDSVNHNSGGVYNTHIYVTDANGFYAIGAISYSLVKIPTDKIVMQQRANMYSSSTPYLILVNRTAHKVGIFQGWQGNWNYVQYWDCSDGKASTPTVEGVFRVGSRGYYFDSGDSRCYWWTQFYGDYLFHSVLYNKYNGALNDGRLGMALSHGCVRLDINNAKWIYDVIPSGTTVIVYH